MDYTGINGTLQFSAGETSKEITIPINDDIAYESAEDFQVSLYSVGTSQVGTCGSCIVTINESDRNPGVLQFNQATLQVDESTSNVNLTVVRTGGSDGTVKVDYVVAGGTATKDSDYSLSEGTLTFANGISSQMIPITINDNSVWNTDKTIIVSLSNATNGANIEMPSSHTLTIKDDDRKSGTIQFNPATLIVNEATTTAKLIVTREGGSDGIITVDYALGSGTATKDTDFTFTKGTLTFDNGETSKEIPLHVKDDNIYETDETVEVVLSNPGDGGTLGVATTGTLTIRDNDRKPGTVQFNPATLEVTEDSSTANLIVQRTGGTDGTITVDYRVTGGTAIDGTDYTLGAGTLTFVNGVDSQVIPIVIKDNATYNVDKTVEVTLSNVIEGNLGAANTVTLIIKDNDNPGTLQFDQEEISVDESTGLANLKVTRTGGTNGKVTVQYKVTGGTATSGSDYTLSEGTLTFENGDHAPQYIPISIIDDSNYEPDETVQVSLSHVTGGAIIGKQSSSTLTIINDDAPKLGTLQFNPATLKVVENSGTALLTVTRTGGTDQTISISYSVTGGAATNGSDYTLTSGTLTFENGETSKTIPVVIKDDTLSEGNETVIVTLNHIEGGATIGSVNSVTLTIMDNDTVSTGGSTGGGSTTTPAVDKQHTPIIVDGKAENIGAIEIHNDQTIVTVDADVLNEKIQDSAKNASVIIPVSSHSDTLLVQLDGQSVTDMRNKEMVLELKTDEISYRIPAIDINIQEIMALWDQQVQLSDIKVTITIAKVNPKQLQEIQQVASENGFGVVGSPMDFVINVSYQGRTQEISRFSQFVPREIEISREDAKKVTTAVVYESDGTVRHVPTFIYGKDNKWYVKINSRTNSTYVLIESDVDFKDTKGKWYETAVIEMASRKIINGVKANLFEGERSITRAEFASIIVSALGLPLENAVDFSDVSSTEWYSKPIATAVKYGLVEGTGDGKFNPNQSITREEAMIGIQKAAKLTSFPTYTNTRNLQEEFNDLENISAWAREAVVWNLNNTLMTGTNGKVRPKDSMTRAEVAAVVLRLLQQSGLVDIKSKV